MLDLRRKEQPGDSDELTADEIMARVIAALEAAGYTAVKWDDGPLPIITPTVRTIQ